MALQDTDFFLVNRNSSSYKMPASVLAAYVSGATVHVGEDPPTGTPSQGDLWWKSDVGILYVYYIDENTSQWVQAAGGAGGSGDGANVSTGIEPPLNAANGDLWFRTDNGRLYVYYTDGDGTNQWVDVSGGGGGGDGEGASVHVGDTPPASASEGDLWWNSSTETLFIYYVDGDNSEWVEASPSGGIEEAPTDGQQYARQNSNWSVIQAGDNNTTINYHGAAAWGQVASDGSLTAGLNIASSGPNGTGRYDITFANAMPSDDYAVTLGFNETSGTGTVLKVAAQTANGFSVFCFENPASAAVTNTAFSFAVHALNALPPQGGTGTDAWGNFSGRTTNGVCTENGSFRIASMTRTDTGQYTVAFTEDMPNTDYSVVLTPLHDVTGQVAQVRTQRADGFDVFVDDLAGNLTDPQRLYMTVNATNAVLPATITSDQIAALIQNPVLSAWGNVTAAGAVTAGFNVDTVTLANTNEFTVEFANPLPNNNYSVVATPVEGTARQATVVGKQPGQFQVRTWSSAGAANAFAFNFQVTGTARNGTLGGGADAWGNILGNTGVLQGGFNCTSARTQGIAAGSFDVTFNNPMPSGYSVVATASVGAQQLNVVSGNQSETGFRLIVSSNTQDLGVDPVTLSFAVFATDGNAGGFWVKEGDGSSEVLKPLNDDATIEAAALTDGITTKTMTEVLAGGGSGGGGGDTIINYNGAAAWATVASNGSLNGNMNLSVVAEGGGIYTYTFDTAMPTADYSVVATQTNASTNKGFINILPASKTVNGFQVATYNSMGDTTNRGHDVVVHALNALPPQGGTGTDAWGSVQGNGTVDGSFNVASVTRTSAGKYDVVFTTPMPNANYSVTTSIADPAVQPSSARMIIVGAKTSTGFSIVTKGSGSIADYDFNFAVNATNASLPNTITEDQIAALIQNPTLSAWGNCDLDGNLVGGFNNTVVKTSNGRYTVTFNNPMPNANYSVTATCNGDNNTVAYINAQTANSFEIKLDGTGSGSPSNRGVNWQVTSTARNGTLGGGADAWGNINGSTATLRGGFNCSVARNGGQTGRYIVTFDNPMPNANYSVVTGNQASRGLVGVQTLTPTQFEITSVDEATGAFADLEILQFAVFATDGNAGGFWTKTDDELAPLSPTADVTIGGNSKAAVFIGTTADDGADSSAFVTKQDGANRFQVTGGGTVRIGGTLPGAPNIELNADGSATFDGNVTAAANNVNLTSDGVRCRIAAGALPNQTTKGGYLGPGSVMISTDSGSPGSHSIFQGFSTNLATRTCYITGDGRGVFNTTRANGFLVNLEPDNPANFSAEGEYTGPTLDVKDRVMNLISRLDAIEANELIDDATDSSLLQLVANASARLDAIEARLSAAGI